MRYKDKTKLVAFRINPEQHEKLTKLAAALNQNSWSYGKITVSQLICDAVDDLTAGDQRQCTYIKKKVKEEMANAKERSRPVIGYTFTRS